METSELWTVFSIVAGFVSLGVATWLYRWVQRQDPGSEKAQEVAAWIKEGATSYLRRLYLALTLVAAALGLIIAIVFSFDIENLGIKAVSVDPLRGGSMALAFLSGAVCSALAG